MKKTVQGSCDILGMLWYDAFGRVTCASYFSEIRKEAFASMKKITFNSPVVLSFAAISGAVLFISYLTGGWFRDMFFVCHRDSLTNPLFYLRLFTHVLGHQNLSHYAGNMTMFLLLGPMLEEKYGSKCLIEIILLVAFVTGIAQVILFPNTGLLGASGVVFAFMILASITGSKSGEIPLTMIIVMVIYLGQEIYSAVFVNDNISQLTHILGGLTGGLYGMTMRTSKK